MNQDDGNDQVNKLLEELSAKLGLASEIGAEMHDLRDDLFAALGFLDCVLLAITAGRPEDVRGHVYKARRAIKMALERSGSPAGMVLGEQPRGGGDAP